MKLQNRVETLELLERYSTPLKAFIHIIDSNLSIDNSETKRLIEIYRKHFTEADVKIAYDINKQIKNRVEELFTYLYICIRWLLVFINKCNYKKHHYNNFGVTNINLSEKCTTLNANKQSAG